jgi:hypothetical protein
MKYYFTFQGNQNEVVAHVKWCRANLGDRGLDWDFSGGNTRIQIAIKNPRSATFYTLKYGKLLADT